MSHFTVFFVCFFFFLDLSAPISKTLQMLTAILYEDDGNQMRCRNARRYSSLHSFSQHRSTFPLSNLGSTESVLDPLDSEVGKAGPFPWKSSWHIRGDGAKQNCRVYTSSQQREKPTLPTAVRITEELRRSWETLHQSETKKKVFKQKD